MTNEYDDGSFTYEPPAVYTKQQGVIQAQFPLAPDVAAGRVEVVRDDPGYRRLRHRYTQRPSGEISDAHVWRGFHRNFRRRR